MVLDLFDWDRALLCEAALQGWIFREEIEISSASGVYLHEGSARITLSCLIAFVECLNWDQC